MDTMDTVDMAKRAAEVDRRLRALWVGTVEGHVSKVLLRFWQKLFDALPRPLRLGPPPRNREPLSLADHIAVAAELRVCRDLLEGAGDESAACLALGAVMVWQEQCLYDELGDQYEPEVYGAAPRLAFPDDPAAPRPPRRVRQRVA